MSSSRTVLVVEDGHEYVDAFARLAPARFGPLEFLRAGGLDDARRAIVGARPDGVFLDVVFDRVPEPALAGELGPLISRFGGDRERAVRHLAENQGFYILDALAPAFADLPVVLAYDFSAEPARLTALRRRVPRLHGLDDGASLTDALEKLLEG